MRAVAHKGPFKGKGGDLAQWPDLFAAGRRAVAAALRDRRHRRDMVRAELKRLADQVRETYRDPPLRIVYARAQGWIWRARSARPETETLIASLAQPRAVQILGQLPASASRFLRAVERRRLDLNTEYLLLGHEIRHLEQWLERSRALGRRRTG